MNFRPYSQTALLYIPLAFFVALILYFSPPANKAPEGYSSVILAFEFAETKENLNKVFEPLSAAEFSSLDKLNYSDFGLIIFYTLILLSFLRRSDQLFPTQLLLPTFIIIVFAFVFDIAENLQLLKLTKLYASTAADSLYAKPLFLLTAFTWTKWLLLACSFAAFGIMIYKRNRFSRIIALFFMLPILLSIYAYFGGVAAKDLFATSVFASFFILLIYCVFYKLESSSNSSL